MTRLHAVLGAAAVVVLTAVLLVPLLIALLAAVALVPDHCPSIWDVIVPPLLFVLIGLPGTLALAIVRRMRREHARARRWVVWLASAAGAAIAIGSLDGWRMFPGSARLSIAMRTAQLVVSPFVRIFWRHDLLAFVFVTAAASAGAALGTRIIRPMKKTLFFLVLMMMLVPALSEARVVKFVVEQKRPFADGRRSARRALRAARRHRVFEVDPKDPLNALIVNLDKAPRTERDGRVRRALHTC